MKTNVFPLLFEKLRNSFMLRHRMKSAVCLLFILANAAVHPAYAKTSILGNGIQLDCTQPTLTVLECDYRLLKPTAVVDVSVQIDDIALPSPTLAPRSEGTSAILFLVDTSDPSRQTVIEGNIKHIRSLLDAITPQQHVGLATFDTELRVDAPLGSSPAEVTAAAQKMRAVGRTTELYRNALRAVQLLAAYPAERRAVFIFSDGLAEDRAYFHQDVIKAAREHGVVIFGFGYARSVAQSVALQTLRRLSEETGGVFLAADADRPLPAEFLADPYGVLENGGHMSVDLAPALTAGLGDHAQVHLTVSTAAIGVAEAIVPVTLPPLPPPEPKIVEKVVEIQVPAPAPVTRSKLAQIPTPARDNPLVWYAAFAAAAILILLSLVFILVRQRKPAASAQPAESWVLPPLEPKETYAFLEIQDGSGNRHSITSAAFRIGRHSDNELVLNDPSISRHHAEILRKRDGSFMVSDLDSMNGVFVNAEQVKSKKLSEEDLIELGDIALRFTTAAVEQVPGDETVMLKTAIPSSYS